MKDNDLIAKRLNNTSRFAKTFQVIPFVKALLLNGSLAQGKSKKTSDIDILTITSSGRLYTARFFMIVLGILTGRKRSKDESKSHAGKFCFNYFLADSYLKIPTGRGEKMDQYCADNYKSSVLIWGDSKIYERFFEINESFFDKYKHNDIHINMAEYFPVANNRVARPIRIMSERLLSGKFGDWFESKIKKFQTNLIQRDERTHRYPDLIVCNDSEARFHPPKINKKLN